MVSKPEALEWIDIADFSAGITGTSETPITPGGDGSAQSAEMCVPGPQGGLIPAPRLITTYSYPTIATVASGDRDPNLPYAAVLDFEVAGLPQIINYNRSLSEADPTTEGQFNSDDEMYILFQHYTLAVPNRRVATLQTKQLTRAGSVDAGYYPAGEPYSRTYTVPTAAAIASGAPYNTYVFQDSWRYYGPGNLSRVYQAHGYGNAPAYGVLACVALRSVVFPVPPYQTSHALWSWGGFSGSDAPSGGWWVVTNDGTGTGTWNTPIGGGLPTSKIKSWATFPATTAAHKAIAVRSQPYYVAGHQGRGIIATGVGDFGVMNGGLTHNQGVTDALGRSGFEGPSSIRFSDPGAAHTPGKWNGYIDITEPIAGIAGMASLSSDDLFIIGQNGGCVRVRGELATGGAQITRHPMLPSAYGRATHLTHTPVGLVWGTRNGVWLWAGGDTAELLSPQLSFDFWWSDEIWGYHAYAAPKGRPVCSYPYLFFPNGWICDLRFKSWFRFGATDSPSGTGFRPIHYALAYNGDILACQPVMPIDGTAFDLIRRYDPSRYHDEWSWQSQPFAKSRNRVLSFREIAVTVHCPVTTNVITLTLSGDSPESGPANWTKTVTINPQPSPQVIRFEMALDVAEAELTMSTDADGGDALAVHRVSLGYDAQRSTRRY